LDKEGNKLLHLNHQEIYQLHTQLTEELLIIIRIQKKTIEKERKVNLPSTLLFSEHLNKAVLEVESSLSTGTPSLTNFLIMFR
jgi:hypothetical protein